MYEKVANTIQQEKLFQPDSRIVVGVSGGADSLCLLDCLSHLGYSLVVAHLDHRLRQESAAEAKTVSGISDRYGWPFVTRSLEPGELEAARGSLEEAARLARYTFFADVAQQQNARYVAVGHTADDQIETVLMHLLRGAGPSGLQGMLPKTSFTHWIGVKAEGKLDLVRPLIECSRAETVLHCDEIGLEPVFDASNEDLSYFRNRLRHDLLPQLELYNPGIRMVIRRLADVMRQQVDFNSSQLRSHWPEIMEINPSGDIVIQLEPFHERHPFLQRALLRHAIDRLVPGLRDIGYVATVRAVAWLHAPSGALSLPGGLSLERYGEDALLRLAGESVESTASPSMPAGVELQLSCPGKLALKGGWWISAEKQEMDYSGLAEMLQRGDHYTALFCASDFPDSLIVRSRNPGDRIQLPNVAGTTKVADLMINRKIPVQLRQNWPVLVAGRSILWIPGVQRCDGMLLEHDATEAVVLQLHSPDEEE